MSSKGKYCDNFRPF